MSKTELLDSVRAKDIEGTSTLLALGAKVNADVMVAGCESGMVDLLKLLLDTSPPPPLNAMSSQGNFPLRAAVMAGDYECISLLIQKGCDVNYESSSRGTALQQACSQGDKDTITLLLDNGADIEHESRDGVTALMAATREDRREAARLLLQRGANPHHVSTATLKGPVDIAQDKGLVEIYSLLLQSSVARQADDAIAGSERRQQQAMQELDAQIESEKQVLKREAQESRAQTQTKVGELRAEREELMQRLGLSKR